MEEEELREARVAIDEAIAEGERGEGRPAEEVFSNLRKIWPVALSFALLAFGSA